MRASGLSSTAFALALVALVNACDAGNHAPSSPDMSSARGGAITSVVQQIQASWAPTGPASGGFRQLSAWNQPISLYATSWNLCLRQTFRIATAQLSPAATADALRAEMTAAGDRGLPSLQRGWLVTRALRWLGQPLPVEDLRRLVGASRADELYSYAPSGPPSWPATQAATEILRAIGARPSAATVSRVRSELAIVGQHPADDGFFLDRTLPVWSIADDWLPPSDRGLWRDSLRQSLEQQIPRIGRSPTGPMVSVLASIYRVANDNGIVLPSLGPISLTSLATPQGYLSLSPDQSAPDPQVTCMAASLGFRPPPVLYETVARTASTDGWVQWSVNPPDPQSSLYALLSLRALGQRWNEDALGVQVSLWLNQVKAVPPSDFSGAAATIFVVALALELKIPTAGWTTALPWRISAIGDRRLDAWSVALASLLAVSPPARDPIKDRVARLRLNSIAEAWEVYLASIVFKEPSWRERAVTAAQRLALPTGAYTRLPSVTTPDLLSTAAGLQMSGANPAQRSRAIAPFGTFPMYSIWPREADAANVSDPEALYLGLLASGRTADTTGLFLARYV
jgi:hypothetical protein